MKIAFPTRDDQSITGHFGRMKAMVVINIVDGEEAARERRYMADMPSCGSEHQSKPSFVVNKLSDCDVWVAGGMGTHMQDKATEANIEVVLTRERLIEEALNWYLDGTLVDEPQLAHIPT